MNRDDLHYVPMLRGKRAELSALSTSGHLTTMTPLVELQPIEGEVPSTVVAKRVNDILQAWYRPLFLDVQGAFDDSDVDLADGYNLVRRAAQSIAEDLPVPEPIPVVDIASPDGFLAAVRVALSEDAGPDEVCIRLRADHVERPVQLRNRLETLVHTLGATPEQVHLVLDLESTVNVAFAEMLTMVVPAEEWGGYTLAWGAFPTQLGSEEEQVHGRHDWTGWVDIHDALRMDNYRAPGFGDYSIVAASPPPSVPRAPNPNLRVTRHLDWLVMRERRTALEGNEAIYRVAQRLVGHVDEGLSAGDSWVIEHARGDGTTGNATTWITVGHQRHFAFVTAQLASRGGSSVPL
ncbi:hypothetical protein [Euzebya sp.]|uniref:beta family protein n=1 Tax=Euzebya sp. TaxID=1971409 RepID=UPI0035120323